MNDLATKLRELADRVAKVEAQNTVPKDQIYTMSVKELVEHAQSRRPVKIEDFTCYDCPLWTTCRFAFDIYNLDDDCLMEK
jgi:hypothetical protein